LADGRVRIDGLMLLTDFNEKFAVDLKDPNYETIAGYMMGQLDRIPKVGDEVSVPLSDGSLLQLRVEVMDGKRIAWIVMRHVTPVPTG
jgi:putative hemolysin